MRKTIDCNVGRARGGGRRGWGPACCCSCCRAGRAGDLALSPPPFPHLADQLAAQKLPGGPSERLVLGGAIPLALGASDCGRAAQRPVRRPPRPPCCIANAHVMLLVPPTSLGAIREARVRRFSTGTAPGFAPPTIVRLSPEVTSFTTPFNHWLDIFVRWRWLTGRMGKWQRARGAWALLGQEATPSALPRQAPAPSFIRDVSHTSATRGSCLAMQPSCGGLELQQPGGADGVPALFDPLDRSTPAGQGEVTAREGLRSNRFVDTAACTDYGALRTGWPASPSATQRVHCPRCSTGQTGGVRQRARRLSWVWGPRLCYCGRDL
jgi:hypothetical protein